MAQVFFVVAHAQTLPIPPTILKPDTSAITTAKPFIAGVSPNDTIVEITVDGAIIGNTITNNHSSGTGNFFFQVESTRFHHIYFFLFSFFKMSIIFDKCKAL